MEIVVSPEGWLQAGDQRYRCALGKAGVTAFKREGDGATPAGRFPVRRLLYRPDRLAAPPSCFPVAPIAPDDGWCDDPAHPDYNRPVRLPHPASCESLWRDDGLYDVIFVLGHNDAPPVPGKGSAIFLHVARPGFAPTEGCVALALADIIALAGRLQPGASLVIGAPTPP